jgi:hypothetical protein
MPKPAAFSAPASQGRPRSVESERSILDGRIVKLVLRGLGAQAKGKR